MKTVRIMEFSSFEVFKRWVERHHGFFDLNINIKIDGDKSVYKSVSECLQNGGK